MKTGVIRNITTKYLSIGKKTFFHLVATRAGLYFQRNFYCSSIRIDWLFVII